MTREDDVEDSQPSASPLPPPDFDIEPPEPPPVVSEKETTRKWIAYGITVIIAVLFVCLAIRYILSHDADDRRDFIHLFEIILTIYGTILGFYFGSQD